MVKFMKENGLMIKLMALECILIAMGPHMKDNGVMTYKMAKV